MPNPLEQDKDTWHDVRHHDELVAQFPVLARAEEVIVQLRQARGQLHEVLTTEILEKDIFSNPEIFVLMETLRQRGFEDSEMDFWLSQFNRNVELPEGAGVIWFASGWGKNSRDLVQRHHRNDLTITNVDINSDIVAMDKIANQAQQCTQIESLVGDITNKEVLQGLFLSNPTTLASIGMLRYLDQQQRTQMLVNLLDTAPKGTTFFMRETNIEGVNAFRKELYERGVGFTYEHKACEHLRYTRFYAYYFMYKGWEPMLSVLQQSDAEYKFGEEEFQAFHETVDTLAKNYQPVNPKEVFGEIAGDADLRYLLALVDLAGYKDIDEQIIIFHN